MLRRNGFSLVELMVALVFTMVLMAGMAKVFQTSLNSFSTTGEMLSSNRRNRGAIDLLHDDLNSAGMFLLDLASPPQQVNADNPPFYILPEQAIANPGPDGPTTADELYFYLDDPLPFEGNLGDTTNERSTAELTNLGQAALPDDTIFTVDCKDSSYAAMIQVGQAMVFKDFFETRYVQAVTQGGSVVTVTTGPAADAGITGISPGGPSRAKHIKDSGVIFFRPAQMVKYSVQFLTLNPQDPKGLPCLVREQGNYSSGGFVSTSLSIITENVSKFKVYMAADNSVAADSSTTWIGFGKTYSGTGVASLWTNGMLKDLDAQIGGAGNGRAGYGAGYVLKPSETSWFRQVPILVRVDLTTRTATKRTEFASTAAVAAFKEKTQTLVLVPRHFGLAMK
ncbi:MAG: hypothetical protein WCR20_09990 [Verrucomicrobiota bacterium]